ncbi:MAG: T9SS type A sorting domain-containing protein [Flavobacteriales bacterium]|nr:T9SS type A sorting domain-containing protein [Flavobacteriales bacterium]
MVRDLRFYILLGGSFFGSLGWCQEPWRKAFGALGPDEASSVLLTSDGNIITAGSTGSFGNGSSDAYILCVSGAGDLLWSRTVGGSQVDHAQSIVELDDGSLVFAGYTNGSGNGGYDGWLVKMDYLANVQWERHFGGTGWDLIHDLQVAPDGGFLLAGSTFSTGAGSSDGWLVRTDAEGAELWSTTFGGTGDDELRSAYVTQDGGVVIAGSQWSEVSGRDVLVAKLDASGGVEWDRTFGTDSLEFAMDVIQTMDGGYSIAGTIQYEHAFNEHWHLRLDAEGNSMWSHTLGQLSAQEATAHVEMPDGRIYTTGYTTTSGGGGKDMFIYRTTSAGGFDFQFTYGGVEDEIASSIVVAPDGFIIAGKTNTFGAGGWDVVIVRTDTACEPFVQQFGDEFDPLEVVENGPIYGAALFPNPASTAVRIRTSDRLTSAHLLDPQGRLVRSWPAPVPQDLDLRGLTDGAYQLVTLTEDRKRASQPLIIAGN